MQLTKRLTDSLARSLAIPPKPEPRPGKRPGTGQEIYWCKDTPGFGVRVTSSGSRAWVFERRVDGETRRRTLGKAMGRAAISADEARRQAVTLSADLQRGEDPLEVKKAQAKQARKDVPLAEAVQQYVDGKRRAKDAKPLKESTKAEYLQLVRGSTPSRRRGFVGQATRPGELYALAAKPLSKITGDDIRELYAQLQKRGKRRASLAMQVLRAVLNWHGVPVAENPFSKDVPGRDRIILPPTTGNPNPIPRASLGAFWRAACDAGRNGNGGRPKAAACVRLVLLTGVRGGESAGSDYVEGILVRHFDRKAGTITLVDTKNRKDHIIYLSRQGMEIALEFAKGKRADDNLFPVRDLRKTLHAICDACGIPRRSVHEIRKTFATVAGALVPHYTLKHMLNHTMSDDVTGEFYMGREEEVLRAGWQAVADFIEQQAALPKAA